jgi:hypothetical protein
MDTHQSKQSNFLSKNETNIDPILSGIGNATLITIFSVLVGGFFHWIYLNQQEYSISLLGGQFDYLSNYGSAFLIAGFEVAAASYFLKKYDIGSTRKIFGRALIVGIAGFMIYLIGEAVSGITSLGQSNIPISKILYNEIIPTVLDYGNALMILVSLFGMLLILQVLFKINPMPKTKSMIPNGAGFAGSVWTASVTSAAAIVCCGPLPGAIALATGISSLYFTALINAQSLIVLISIPLLLFAVILADRRAIRGCKLRNNKIDRIV